MENPETENSQIPAPLYVNKMGKSGNRSCKFVL